MNEKKYTLAGCTQCKAIMMVEKQTLFQSLFLILSQLEELDKDNYQNFKETIEDIIGATVDEEEKLRGELDLEIDYDESDEFSEWESEYIQFVSGNQYTYVLAKMLERLILEDNGEIWFDLDEFSFSTSNTLDFNINCYNSEGFHFFAKFEDGGQN